MKCDDPLRNLPSLVNEVLKVNKSTTVKEMKNYIVSKLNQNDFDIVLIYKSNVINDNRTLSEILNERGLLRDSKFDMKIFYYKNFIIKEE